jgi:prepilin-type N-terminal cleavage/methylation domain-containing protein
MLNCRRTAGFTLIELMISIAILGLLFGLALPSLNRVVEKQALMSYSKQLAGDLRYVRQKNINGNLALQIQLAKNKYTIREGIRVIDVKQAPQGINFLDKFSSFIHFNAHGVPIGVGATTLRLKNSCGDIYEVIIMVNTGRVRVQPKPNT